MATATSTRRPATRTTSGTSATLNGDSQPAEGPYRLPVVGVGLPPTLVETGFWGVLVGSAVLGAVDPPLAALVGAGVLIARHRRG